MRRRFNRSAICSVDGNSGSYETSRKAHKSMLQERHTHFCGLVVSGELQIDVPKLENGVVQPKFKTLRIWGKDIRVTVEEYNTFMATCK